MDCLWQYNSSENSASYRLYVKCVFILWRGHADQISTAADKSVCRGQLKCDGTRAETRFHLSAKRASPFKSAEASVQSTTGSRGVHISGSNAGYTVFRGSVKGTDYPHHSPVSPSLPLPSVTVRLHISIGNCLSVWVVVVR